MSYKSLACLTFVCSLAVVEVLAQTARSVQEDAEVRRIRACLWGEFKVDEGHSISIAYLGENSVTKIEVRNKDAQLVSVLTPKNYCVSKMIANGNHALILINYQRNWSLWSRALLFIDYSEGTTCDIKWFLTSEPESSLGELDIGFAPNSGFCFKRTFHGKIDAIKKVRVTATESNWYSLNGLSVDFKLSKLKKVEAPNMNTLDSFKVFLPGR